jgi:type II secretory pathway predicted ATPase ExeA
MARDRIGPIYMYGPIGSGKTSLVRRLQEKLSQDERYTVKLLISPNLKSSNAFLRLILETFDVKTERSYAASLRNFEDFLYDQLQQKNLLGLIGVSISFLPGQALSRMRRGP